MNSFTFVTDVFCHTTHMASRGASIHLYGLLKDLEKLDFDVSVVQMGEKDSFYRFEDIPICEVGSKSIAEFRDRWPEFVDHSQHIHLNNVDCHTPIMTGLRTATIHTNIFIESSSARDYLVNCMSSLDEVAVVNRAYIEAFPEYKSKLHLIRNGVNPLLFFYQEPTPPEYGKRVLIFFPNKPSPKKSLETALGAIDMLAQIQDKFTFELWVAGSCPEDLKSLIDSRSNVRFLGELIYPEQMINLYHQSHLVVVPSKSESCSLVALESMSCGTPVLAADVPGLNEIIFSGKTGLLIPNHSPESWAKSILMLCRDRSLYRSLSMNARSEVSNRFHLSEMVSGYLEMWDCCYA